jgi:hypothetical protein
MVVLNQMLLNSSGIYKFNYEDAIGSTSNLSTYTAANRPIGEAANDRYVVVCAYYGHSSLARNVSSVTVGGESLIEIEDTATTFVGFSAAVAIYAGKVSASAGDTADVVLTLNGAAEHAAIWVYSFRKETPATSVPITVDSISSRAQNVGSLSDDISIKNGGFVIGVFGAFVGGTPTFTVGLTDDEVVNSSEGDGVAASLRATVTDATFTCTATNSTSTDSALALISLL